MLLHSTCCISIVAFSTTSLLLTARTVTSANHAFMSLVSATVLPVYLQLLSYIPALSLPATMKTTFSGRFCCTCQASWLDCCAKFVTRVLFCSTAATWQAVLQPPVQMKGNMQKEVDGLAWTMEQTVRQSSWSVVVRERHLACHWAEEIVDSSRNYREWDMIGLARVMVSNMKK